MHKLAAIHYETIVSTFKLSYVIYYPHKHVIITVIIVKTSLATHTA